MVNNEYSVNDRITRSDVKNLKLKLQLIYHTMDSQAVKSIIANTSYEVSGLFNEGLADLKRAYVERFTGEAERKAIFELAGDSHIWQPAHVLTREELKTGFDKSRSRSSWLSSSSKSTRLTHVEIQTNRIVDTLSSVKTVLVHIQYLIYEHPGLIIMNISVTALKQDGGWVYFNSHTGEITQTTGEYTIPSFVVDYFGTKFRAISAGYDSENRYPRTIGGKSVTDEQFMKKIQAVNLETLFNTHGRLLVEKNQRLKEERNEALAHMIEAQEARLDAEQKYQELTEKMNEFTNKHMLELETNKKISELQKEKDKIKQLMIALKQRSELLDRRETELNLREEQLNIEIDVDGEIDDMISRFIH